MKTTFLYTLSDPETGKIRYLGKSDNPFKRFKRHLYDRDESHKSRWVETLRVKGLRPHMDLLDEVPVSQWKFWECEYIRVFRAIGIPLVNLTNGGDSGPNMESLTDEIQARIRTGGCFTRSEATIKKMSDSALGKPKSAEHRAAMSRAKLGKKLPSQTKERMRLSHLEVWANKSPEEREALIKNLRPSHAFGHTAWNKGLKKGKI